MHETDVVEVLADWPQPEPAFPDPQLRATDGRLALTYATAANTFAAVRFPMCHQVKFGAPNDEALEGHPLRARGLDYYAVHSVKNSSWLTALERMNSVHARHGATEYIANKVHFVFTFHDSTLECIATVAEPWSPVVSTFATFSEAHRAAFESAP
jgi:hypothetical protein